jgi:2-polyprenyl-3-methyl-5-hydroxy-6-metoxy-1,4-benzoquinol methylase
VSSVSSPPSPQLFLETVSAYQRTEAVRAALELDLFTAIATGHSSTAQLALQCAAAEKGMRVLCDYLAFVGFLKKKDDQYSLTPDSAVFLDRRSPAYMGGMLEFLHTDTLRKGYANLAAAVRKGGTVVSDAGLADPEHPDWVRFAKAMVPMMAMPAQLSAQLVPGPVDRKLKVLDIAAGHGMYGIEVGKRFPRAEIIGLDWAKVLVVAKENAQKAGLGERYRTIAGDAFDVALGNDYDVVLIPNFLHHFGFARCVGFCKRVHQALKPGGIAITVEFVPNEDRMAPPFPATFAMAMLVVTAEGDAYTYSQLDDMLRQAGFQSNTLHSLEPSAQHAVVSSA